MFSEYPHLLIKKNKQLDYPKRTARLSKVLISSPFYDYERSARRCHGLVGCLKAHYNDCARCQTWVGTSAPVFRRGRPCFPLPNQPPPANSSQTVSSLAGETPPFRCYLPSPWSVTASCTPIDASVSSNAVMTNPNSCWRSYSRYFSTSKALVFLRHRTNLQHSEFIAVLAKPAASVFVVVSDQAEHVKGGHSRFRGP